MKKRRLCISCWLGKEPPSKTRERGQSQRQARTCSCKTKTMLDFPIVHFKFSG